MFVEMAESSDARDVSLQKEELEYIQASNVNVSDFVSVKFSKRNFPIWEQQMLCLMESKMMDGMVNEYDTTAWRQGKSDKIIKKYETLLRGWILGSLNEQVLRTDIYCRSPMEIWKKLKEYSYGSTNLGNHGTGTTFTNRYKDGAAKNSRGDIELQLRKKNLYDAALKGNWWRAKSILKNHKEAAMEVISTQGNTMLHVAIREGNNYFVQKLLNFIEDGKLIEQANGYRYTSLHFAAKFGNIDAAKLLVEKRKILLHIGDRYSTVPLMTAFEERQLSMFVYLSEVTENREKYLSSYSEQQSSTSVDLLAKAISTKQYDLATKLIDIFHPLVATDSEVFKALIMNFPSELGFGEALLCPSLKYVCDYIVKRSSSLSYSLEYSYTMTKSTLWSMRRSKKYYSSWLPEIIMILLVPIAVLYPIYQLILFLIVVLLFPLFTLYFLLWNAFAFLVPPIKLLKKTKKEFREAKEITRLIRIKHEDADCMGHYQLKNKILEAARLDAYIVLRQFLGWSHDPMKYFTEGHNIMQLAVKNRSNKIYKLVCSLNDDATEYKTGVDTFGNNLVHLAGQLPHSNILRCTTGAALQLQRELQWFEEVASHAEHRLLTERNKDDETPEMVFTREHSDLVKEGENWMKTTAESCSITAALIFTIVFAAAITVPGGSNQDTGIPLLKKQIAFTIFAVSDAISLFTGATSLSVFLSILTTRFAEKDFLVVLPRRLLIGLFLLLISTTAMMVAFSTILFLVFCDQIQWMLGPIGALACMPIAAIVFLQFPLMFDLFKSTYFPIFGNEESESSSEEEEEE